MIIKLHTVDSTNSYLKRWLTQNQPENYMIVRAERQTAGRGQRDNTWISEAYKNLLFSMFVEYDKLPATQIFRINQVISLALIDALKPHIQTPAIKWPNDIMSGQHKIAGILIENRIQKGFIKHSIVGIGLNVNQASFPADLPQASSLRILTGKSYNREVLLQKIKEAIIKRVRQIKDPPAWEKIHTAYMENLYLAREIARFSDSTNTIFEGKIIGVNEEGMLQILDKKGKTRTYAHKEVVFL